MMNKLKYLILICLMNFLFSMAFSQINVTTKLDLSKSLGNAMAKEFQQRIFRAALAGTLPIFKDDSLVQKMPAGDINDRLNNEEVIQVYPDPNNPDFSVDSVIKSSLTEKDISGFMACAIFSPDAKNRLNTVQYRSFAISIKMVKAGYDLGEQAIFWFSAANLPGLFNAVELEKFRKSIHAATDLYFTNGSIVSGISCQQLPLNKYIGKNALLMFNRKIYAGLLNGKLPAYSDMAFTKLMTPEEVAACPGQKEKVQIGGADSMLYYPLKADSIYLYFMTEAINFDETRLSFTAVLNGMAQGYDLINNSQAEVTVLSWMKFSDLFRFLGETEYSGLIKIVFKATRDQFDIFTPKD